jgi:hypothetical protein
MTTPKDIVEYNAGLEPAERGLCERFAEVFGKVLPKATCKVWHAHPVWFVDGNPVVGYATRKNGISVLFWSGQSFADPGLKHTGSSNGTTATFDPILASSSSRTSDSA